MDIFKVNKSFLSKPVVTSSWEDLKVKMKAYKVLFGTEPYVEFRGYISDAHGDTAFLDHGSEVSGISGSRVRLEVNGGPEWFDIRKAEKGFRFEIV